jgi:phosphate-selective porin OprO and OprP
MNATTPAFIRALLAAVIVSAGLMPARAADAAEAEIKALREQIRLLDERLHQLEQKQQLKDQEAAAAAKAAPKINVTDKGFTFASGDGANSVRIGGLVQLDSRLFLGDGGGIVNNTFVLRRARFISEATFNQIYSFQLVPEFGGSAVSILDANLSVAPSSLLQFKAGRFKVPVGLEFVQADTATFFAERSLVTNLVPSRDLGVQLGGSYRDGVVAYALGVFNGVADANSTSNVDFDNEKEVAGRLFVQPFKGDPTSPWRGLGLGVAGSIGREKGPSAVTAGYKTDGQQGFFKYSSAVIADGRIWRVSPQGYFYRGPLGLLGEYVVSTVNVRPGATGAKAALQNQAWQLAAGYVLTGEDSTFASVTPRQPFSWTDGTWGAWQMVVRYSDLKIDGNAFPLFASPATNAGEASSLGLGLNWYLSKTVRTSLDYFRTRFNTPAPVPSLQILRQDEQALITRFQLTF